MKRLVIQHFSIIVFFTTAISGLNGQGYVALHNGDSIYYYTSFLQAIDSAQNNDTIYLPGGTQNIGTLSIDKKLHVYGVGYFPDSCLATRPTILNGNLRIITGADGGLLSGVQVSGTLYFGTSGTNQVVNNYTITRSRITSNCFLSYNGTSRSESTGIILSENIFNGLFYGGYVPLFIERCIFNSYFHYIENSYIRNSNFLYRGLNSSSTYVRDDMLFYHTYNNDFDNSIIMAEYYRGPLYYSSGISGNTFTNCLFYYDVNFDGTDNTGENCIVGATPVFANVTNMFAYSLSYDYHLDPSSPGVVAGTDGTDVGVYGTDHPFQHVPVNPHVYFKNIERQLSDDGELNINIKVRTGD